MNFSWNWEFKISDLGNGKMVLKNLGIWELNFSGNWDSEMPVNWELELLVNWETGIPITWELEPVIC